MSLVIKLTPRGLETPEGVERVNKAMKEFEDKTAQVANRATQFLTLWRGEFRTPRDPDIAKDFEEDLKELLDAIDVRLEAQEQLLRSLAGA